MWELTRFWFTIVAIKNEAKRDGDIGKSKLKTIKTLETRIMWLTLENIS